MMLAVETVTLMPSAAMESICPVICTFDRVMPSAHLSCPKAFAHSWVQEIPRVLSRRRPLMFSARTITELLSPSNERSASMS